MIQWPDFNENGDLPPGIHQATLAEVIEHFGQTTPQRQIMARRRLSLDRWGANRCWATQL